MRAALLVTYIQSLKIACPRTNNSAGLDKDNMQDITPAESSLLIIFRPLFRLYISRYADNSTISSCV